ncbi:MAG: hypothetical protein PHS57_07840 [Alphaproteobacteria bacterium]|nr:hypothetical protein [Alphaproteobacteria bacterium]
MTNENDSYTSECLCTTGSGLLPLLFLSITVVGFLLFQTYSIVSDRVAVDSAISQQEKSLQEVEKVKEQVSALIRGVIEMSKKGNNGATDIIEGMKKAGITFQDDQPKDAEDK